MSSTIVITEQDRLDAENLLEQFLSANYPTGDFSKGDMLRDFVISGFASVFAYIQQEVDITRARQSLLLLSKLAGADVDDAVDEILSNWFITRKAGQLARGVVTVYLSQSTDISVPITAKFYKTSALIFLPDALDTVTVAAEDLTQIVDANGVIVSYAFQLLVKASLPGKDYEVSAGSFVDFTRFSPYIIRVENQNAFSGGGDIESTAEMLDRSNTAITVRDLNSARSIDATLKDEFDTVDDVTVIGYGDPEMIRDLVLEEATNTRIHAGGMVDNYLRSPIQTGMTFSAAVGGLFNDPRPGYFILRDDTIPDFTALALPPVAGDVIIIRNALTASEAQMYIIKQVTPYGLYVSRRTYFPKELPTVMEDYTDGHVEFIGGENRVYSTAYIFSIADVGSIVPPFRPDRFIRVYKGGLAANVGTGKITAVNTTFNYAVVDGFPSNFTTESSVHFAIESRVVEYTVGNNSPTFNNKISLSGNPCYSGMFTKEIQNNGRVLLPAWPIYLITDVSIPGAGIPPTWLSSDGKMHFTNRVNIEPARPVSPAPGNFQFQVICNNPSEAYSGWQVIELDIAWPTVEGKTYFNNKVVTVTFDTLSGYDVIWSMMTSTDRRIECGAVIPKGLHPIYITFEIQYKLKRTASSDIDIVAAAQAITDFINAFDTTLNALDISAITTFFRTTYPDVGFIETSPLIGGVTTPLTFYYALLAPDGRVIQYATTDVITIDPANQTADPIAQPDEVLTDPLSQGVSDNTVRYLTTPALITLTNIG